MTSDEERRAMYERDGRMMDREEAEHYLQLDQQQIEAALESGPLREELDRRAASSEPTLTTTEVLEFVEALRDVDHDPDVPSS